MAEGNKIFLYSNNSLPYYLNDIAHEFIHVDIAERYVDDLNYSFLTPDDFAFQYLMEEAFANMINVWMRLNYPQETDSDLQIRNWAGQPKEDNLIDAMRNDLRVKNPDWREQRINDTVIENMFTLYIGIFEGCTAPYAPLKVPNCLKEFYADKNTFLIPEYAAYRERGDMLLRHQWDYLCSIMPFTTPPHMTYDYCRSLVKSNYRNWTTYSDNPNNTILYWTNYDYIGNAKAKIAKQKSEDVRYDYLSLKNEERLNSIFSAIDPYFIPVNTGTTTQRLLQALIEKVKNER
jgi:hypothetical protein